MDKLERIKELTQQLNHYRNSYYNDSVSEISDKEYDNLFDELKELEEKTGVVMANSPIHTVGYEVKSKLEKTKHSHPMLSLDKTKSVDDLKRFAGDKGCLFMCKMDGLSILLTYDDGELVRAETRGNGEVGEDVTHNARVFENIPLHIAYKDHLEVEGEAIITYSDFDKINNSLPENEKYKNSRNLVSGSVRQLDSNIAAQRHIKFIAWKVPYIEDKISNCNDFRFRLLLIESFGFEIVPFAGYSNDSSGCEECEHIIEYLKEQAKIKGYPIDGLVITYNNISYGESLGATDHHPKHSLAFKFYDDIYPTKLLDVEFTMGKTGTLTPTAVFEPVEIDGSTIERASLHNLSIMNKLDLSYGDTITVYKANAVIPQVEDNLDKSHKHPIIPPVICPICNSKTEIIKDNNAEVLICTNPDCRGKLIGKLSHFVSKNAINIDGLSDQTLQKFIDLGWLNSFKDIYYIADHKEEIQKLEGFGKKSVNKLLDSIDKSRNTTLDRFIYGLCIPLIGRTASKTIAKEFGNGNATGFYDAWSDYDFSGLEDFGYAMNKSMHNFYNQNYKWIPQLIDEFNFEISEKFSNTNLAVYGKTFVITGSLNHYKNRDELVSVIEEFGGKVLGSVSTKTNYLINNDVTSISGKNKRAHELGVPIISEGEFVKMITS